MIETYDLFIKLRDGTEIDVTVNGGTINTIIEIAKMPMADSNEKTITLFVPGSALRIPFKSVEKCSYRTEAEIINRKDQP